MTMANLNSLKPAATSSWSAAGNFDLSRINVVVVDDSNHMLRLLKMILRAMEILSIRCIPDPRRAFEEMRETPPDLVITDLFMTPIDGLDLTRQIRACERNDLCFTPVFALTGFTDVDHVLQARNSGVHEVLGKPISTERLYRRIISHVEHPRRFISTGEFFGPERRGDSSPFQGDERRQRRSTT